MHYGTFGNGEDGNGLLPTDIMSTHSTEHESHHGEPNAPSIGQVQCDITERWVEPDEVISFLGYTVSAEGKELLLERLKSGDMVSGLWRDGRTLVVHKDAEFPDRCVICNLARRCSDYSPIVTETRLLQFRTIQIRVPVCPQHWRNQHAASLGHLLLISLTMALWTCAVLFERPWSIPVVLASYVFATTLKDKFWQRVPLSGEVMEKEHVRLEYASKDYLENLPEWHGN